MQEIANGESAVWHSNRPARGQAEAPASPPAPISSAGSSTSRSSVERRRKRLEAVRRVVVLRVVLEAVVPVGVIESDWKHRVTSEGQPVAA